MISVVAQTSMLILSARAFSMTDFTTFVDSQTVLIALSWIARGACELITTAGVAWTLKKHRVPDFSQYDMYAMSPITPYNICYSMVTTVDRLIYWTLGKIGNTSNIG
jgi:hypothetical protein